MLSSKSDYSEMYEDMREGFSSIYPESYKPVFEQRIKQYEKEIRFHEAEARHPWRKWFRFKTYKRKLKRMLKMRKA